MKKVRIGVLGAYRGSSMINYCKRADNAQVVAICDKSPEALDAQRENAKGLNITFYDNFDDFIQHDMDAVVLANYAHQHAPFAIRALERGLHVFSEVLPCQNMKEAVALIEAVEKSGKVYAYGENYCYMASTYEMRRLYREGVIGELEYAECEYIHNCEEIAPSITYGDPNHWRNNGYSTFYCTHSLGPIIHMTGLRPVSVTGFEALKNERNLRRGSRSAQFGIEMVRLSNDALVKSIHGGLYKDSIWYTVYGSKGRLESAREDTNMGREDRLYVNYNDYPGEYENSHKDTYLPKPQGNHDVEGYGHGGSDFYSMYHFVEKILGNPEADTIDVYEAMDMYLPGMFAYRSILAGGIPMDIPDLRDPAQREAWRNDTACTDKEAAGDMLWPTTSQGTPDIPMEVYERVAELWRQECESDNNYRSAAFKQGSKPQ